MLQAAILLLGGLGASVAHGEIVAGNTYAVKDVSAADVLQVRAQPSANAPSVGFIPSDGKGIVASGGLEKIGDSVWAYIGYRDIVGWVNTRFLTEDRGLPTNLSELHAAGISIRRLNRDLEIQPEFMGTLSSYPNKCPYAIGSEDIEVSVSNEMLAHFQQRGFSLKTLCLAITAPMVIAWRAICSSFLPLGVMIVPNQY